MNVELLKYVNIVLKGRLVFLHALHLLSLSFSGVHVTRGLVFRSEIYSGTLNTLEAS
jgi:hypothetical protein